MFFNEFKKNCKSNQKWLFIGILLLTITLIIYMDTIFFLTSCFYEYYDFSVQGLMFVTIIFPFYCMTLFLVSFRENLYTTIRVKPNFSTLYNFLSLLLVTLLFTIGLLIFFLGAPYFYKVASSIRDSTNNFSMIMISGIHLFATLLFFGSFFMGISGLIKNKKLTIIGQIVIMNTVYFTSGSSPMLKNFFFLGLFNRTTIKNYQDFFSKFLILIGVMSVFYSLSIIFYKTKENK